MHSVQRFTPPMRPKTHMERVFMVFEMMRQPLTAGYVREIIDMPETTVRAALAGLMKRGLVRKVPDGPALGPSVQYELVPGAARPEDMRGKSEGSAAARKRNPRAAGRPNKH